MKTYKSVDEYIKLADKDKQNLLKTVREIVKKTIPDAEEGIAYGMPAYSWKSKGSNKSLPLFYFAAMKGHLGLYPTPGPIETNKGLLSKYSTSKGCVRIPYGEPVPEKIIVRLLKERVSEIKKISK